MSRETEVFLMIYLSIIGTGIIFATILFVKINKTVEKLPNEWKKASYLKKNQRSILLLLMYLLINFISECIAIYLNTQHIYNSFVMAINSTLSTLFLFGFLLVNTQIIWRKYSYLILYLILIGYFISGGYYHPHSNFTGNSALIMNTIYFLATLIHLTELLVHPKLNYFRLLLKFNLTLLIYTFLSVIIVPFLWYGYDLGLPLYFSKAIFYIHLSNIILFYSFLALIILSEILKLNHSTVK